MDFSYLSNGPSEDVKYKMNKNISGDEESVEKSFSASIFEKEVSVTDRSAEYYNKPLQVSHGAQIMANEVGVSQSLGLLFLLSHTFNAFKLEFVIERA